MQDSPDYPFLTPLNLATRGATTDHVQDVLREAIVSSALPAGTLINKHAICERLGVSRFPVSEALNRLQAEGLVDILPQRGTRVSRIRLSDVRESMFVRRAIEGETLRFLAAAPPPGLFEALGRNMRYQHAAVDAADWNGFHTLDLEFHAILSDALAFPRAKAVLDTVRGSQERVRRILTSNARYAITLQEHVAIVAALESGDAARAAQSMATHLDNVLAALLVYAKDKPEIFEDISA